MGQTYSSKTAIVAEFSVSDGDVEKQAEAFLKRNPGFEVRVWEWNAAHDVIKVAFIIETERSNVTILPDGDWLLPMDDDQKARLNLRFRDLMGRPSRTKLAHRWVHRCLTRALDVAAGSATEDSRTLFWIELHDVLDKFRVWLEGRVPTAGEDCHPDDEAFFDAADALKELIAILEPRDLLVLAFFRTHAAHFQGSVFSYRDPGKISILNRNPSAGELTQLFKHVSEETEAKALAAKVIEPLRALLVPLDELAKD
jgi:hypothetical protein